jgi:D-alanyl-D-alanine carboxypeptidase/D-alanyl-D-alanine-endopeptidase (penicillin-binding protein 4)
MLPSAAAAQDAPTRLAARFQALVQDAGLEPDQVALLVLSTRHRAVLMQHRATELMPAASNTKLVMAYAALRALSPNFRWRTRISRIAEHDGAVDTGRQGLLIDGAGDPTLLYADLESIAQRLRAAGIRKLRGGLYLRDALYGAGTAVAERALAGRSVEVLEIPLEGRAGDSPQAPGEAASSARPPPAGEPGVPGQESGAEDTEDETGQAAPSAFVVEHNAPALLISLLDSGTVEVLSRLPAEALRILSRVQAGATQRSVLHLEQAWDDAQGTIRLSGTVSPGQHSFTVPITQPAAFFAHLLRAALHRQGIEGALPLRGAVPQNARRELLFSHYSPPLREAIGPILRDSDNLAADGLLWTLAAQGRPAGKTGALDPEDGLRWVRRVVQQDFPGIQNEMELSDGSGLKGESRFSARALVRVLSGALGRPEFGPEFLGALSRAGWDGTLRYRAFPEALQGRLRAKTGTLRGVQNLTGVLALSQDEVVFSFLIAAPGRARIKLQAAQDRITAELYELLRKEEIRTPEFDPLAPKVLAPPPPSPKPGRRKSLPPPSPSPKP